MKITSQLKPALISHWMIKAFKTFYPNCEFVAVSDAPNTWKELKAFKGCRVLPVYNGNCNNTIYQHERDNHIFRAWHDSIHLEYGLSFKPENELKVARIHCNQLRAIKAPQHVIDAIWYDVAGQIEYYCNFGEFVTNQKDFVQNCLVYGLEKTILSHYDTARQC